MTGKARLHVILSLVGILGLITSLALAAGTMRPTEATWQDTVVGESQFGIDENAGKNFARFTAIYGTAQSLTGIFEQAELTGNGLTVTSGWDGQPHGSSPGVPREDRTGIINVTATADGCGRAEDLGGARCLPEPSDKSGSPTSYATSTLTHLEIEAAGLERTTFGAGKSQDYSPIVVSAACSPGRDGVAELRGGGPLMVGRDGIFGDDDRSRLDLPTAENPVTWTEGAESAGYDLDATLLLMTDTSRGYAMAQLRLHIVATGKLLGTKGWSTHLLLAHAECGASVATTAVPELPDEDNWPLATQPAHMMMAAAPAALQPITDLAEEELAEAEALEEAALEGDAASEAAETDTTADADNLEPELPSLTDAAQAIEDEAQDSAEDASQDETSEAATTTPVTSSTSPDTSAPAESDAQATETAPAETSTSTPSTSTPSTTVPVTTAPETTAPETSETAAPETTEPTEPTTTAEATPGPQTPQNVTLGRKFALTALDGTHLGTATIEDVQHTADCGVEITLHLTTSDEAGPDRLDSLGPGDFAEVSPSGATRDVQRVTSECEQSANSRTTTLQPGSSTRIVIAFRVSDTATAAMLRPDGTAGWTFPLT